MKFGEYIDGSNFLLTEVKLSRVWKHLSDDDIVVGVITAFRDEYDYNENKKRNLHLAQTLRQNGYGYFFVDGSWIENEGNSDETHVNEDSIFVTGKGESDNVKLFDLLVDLSKKYNQDGFSFKKSGKNSKYEIIDKHGKVVMSFGSVGYDKFATVYTKLRNKKGSFVFENAYTGVGFIGHMIHKNKN